MNYEYYKIFYAVGKHKNITRAAAELYSSQPSITRAIKTLEHELGCTLFVRTRTGVEFTHEGELLYEYVSAACVQLIKGEEELSNSMGVEGGVIYIATTVTALHCYLFECLDRYREKFPKVKFKISTASSDKTIEKLKNGTVDLAFVTTPFTDRGEHKYTDIMTFNEILIAGNKYRHLKEERFDLKNLENYPFICLSKGMQQREFVDKVLTDHGVSLTPEIESDSANLLVHLVLHNWGLALVPEHVAKSYVERDQIVKLDIGEELPIRKVCMISDSSRPHSRAARELVKQIKSEIAR